MKLEISNGAVRPVSLFKFVALGYGLGAGVVLLPLTFVVVIVHLFGGTARDQATEELFAAIVLFPFVLGMQALMFAGLITLGLWIYSRWRRIEIVQR